MALKNVYENRFNAVRKWVEGGGRAIATLGCDVPDEILIAARLLPVRVCGDINKPIHYAAKYLENSVDDDTLQRTMFENLVDGTYNDLFERLVISYSSAREYNLLLILRELRRLIPELPIPPLYFIDFTFIKYLIHQERCSRMIEKFRKSVESWVGFNITESMLLDAIDICNDNRQALREFDSLRNSVEMRVTGTEALTVIGAGLFMDKKEHTALVRDLTKEAKSWPLVDATRILMIGSDQETTELYEIVERAGGNIVMEDHNWGARHYDMDVKNNTEPIKCISNRYFLRMPGKRSTVKEKVRLMRDCIEQCGAEAVLFYLNTNDNSATWDYPSQKKLLDEMNIPHKIFTDMIVPIQDPIKLKDELKNLVKSVKGGK